MVKSQCPTRQFVAGRFRLLEEVRRSEKGTDWRGEDVESGRQVAIRELLLPEGLDATARRRLVARMLREAELMSLVCPGRVVTVIDVAEEDGRLWQVAELVEASPLNKVLADEGPFDPVRAVRYALDLLDVLGAAHREGITHGDVNPSQVLLRPEGGIVLTGFGVTTAAASMPITSPSYASPERARGEGPGPASDLWSLGAVLYAMVEGRPPYRDRGSAELTLAAVASEPVPPPQRAGPLLLAVNGLLRKDPRERADEPVVRRVLERILAEEAEKGDAAADSVATADLPTTAPSWDTTAPSWDTTAPFWDSAATAAAPPAAPDVAGPSAEPRETAATDLDVPLPLPRTRPVGLPEEGAGRTERDWRPRPLTVIAVALMVVVATMVGVFVINGRLIGRSDDAVQGSPRLPTRLPPGKTHPKPSAPASSGLASPTPPSHPPGTGTPVPPENPEVALPPGYTMRQDVMFSIALPDGWRRVGDNGFSSGSRFSATGDPRNLLVDFTDSPGPDPVAAWRQLESSVNAGSTDYHRIGQIRAVRYRGWNAADWEWNFTFHGIRYRTLNRGFIVDEYHGFAIKWTVPADDWESKNNQKALEVFLTSFQPKTR